MAEEKDPKVPDSSDEEKPKRRTPRRKTKAKAAAAMAAAPAPEESAVGEEPVAEEPAVGEEPAAEEPAAEEPVAKAAPAKAKTTKAKAKPADVADVDAEPAAEEKPKPARRARRKADDDKPAAPADKPAAPAAKPRRTRRVGPDHGDTPPMVRAHAKYVRTSARKARLVCDHIRGKSVPEARAILAHASRDVARDWSKLLESAVANAEHNHELIGDELRIHAVKADEGPTLKRFRPRAMGRATKILKRTSHLSITLTPKVGE